MDRRAFARVVGLGLLSAPRFARAQQAAKVFRVGYLSVSSSAGDPHLRGAFRQGLRELGWVEGQNVAIEYRFAEGRPNGLPDLAAELIRLKVDVIVAPGSPATAAAKSATGTIPVVMVGSGQPVELGFITSLARPGGIVTGLSFSVGWELFGKQLELVREIVPKVRRVAVLSNPANSAHASIIENVKVAARSLEVPLQLLEARRPDEFDGAFTAMVKERVRALLVLADGTFLLHKARLTELAAKSRLPAAYGYREHVDAGGLISYGPSLSDLWRRAAVYVDKILKGAKPADLPVEQPTKFELVINLKTARALGLTIPQSLLLRADEVIQ